MIIKYRRILLLIYLGANLIYTFYFSYIGLLGGDFFGSGIVANPYLLTVSFFQILIVFLFYLKYIFRITDKIEIRKEICVNKQKLIDVFYLFIVLFYLVLALSGGTSYSIPFNATGLPHIFAQIRDLLSIEDLIKVYVFFGIVRASKLYFFNVVAFTFGMLYAGKTGIILYFVPLYFIFKMLKGEDISNFRIMLFLTVGMILLPIVRFLKLSIGFFLDDTAVYFSDVLAIYQGNNDIWGIVSYFFMASFERFQHVANISYIIENVKQISHDIYYLDPFINNHISIYLLNSSLGINHESTYFNSYLASLIINKHWATHSGVTGIIYAYGLSGFVQVILYSILLFIGLLIIKLFKKNYRIALTEYIWINTLLLFSHGWFSAFYSTIYALIIFIFTVLLINRFQGKLSL